jgi:hypothetical protein
MANKVMSPDRPEFENRGAAAAEAYYGKLTWDGASIIRSAELLYVHWTRGDDVRMHAIADGFRRQAYIIAQVRAGT